VPAPACRELFYDDKPLFKNKAYSDSSIRLLSSILQVRVIHAEDCNPSSTSYVPQLTLVLSVCLSVMACARVQLQRDELSLVSSAKGLIMGDLQFEVSCTPLLSSLGAVTEAATASTFCNVHSSAFLLWPLYGCEKLEDFADPDADESAHPAMQLVNCETAQTITPYAKQIRGETHRALPASSLVPTRKALSINVWLPSLCSCGQASHAARRGC